MSITNETQKLLESIGSERIQKLFEYKNGELCLDFLGFLPVYIDLANLPKDFTIIDFGCNQAAQADYFRKFRKYIGVDSGVPKEYMLSQENAEYFNMTGQRFISLMKQAGILDVQKTFAICSYVPSEELYEMIKNAFPYHRIVYSNGIISENYPNGFEPSIEYKSFCSKKEI